MNASVRAELLDGHVLYHRKEISLKQKEENESNFFRESLSPSYKRGSASSGCSLVTLPAATDEVTRSKVDLLGG
jgi:hypothetical protein